MLDRELFIRYRDCVENLKLVPAQLRGIALAIVEADYLHGTSHQPMDIDLFAADNDEVWNEYKNFIGETLKGNTDIGLPRVQKLRVLCDSLYLLLKYNKIEVKEGVTLTQPSSSEVASLMGVHVSSVNTYLEEDDCLRILELLLATGKTYEELKKLIAHHLKNSNELYGFGFVNSMTIPRLVLPKAVKECFRSDDLYIDFVSDADFESVLNGKDLKTYLASWVVTASAFRTIEYLRKIFNRNRATFCAIMHSWLESNEGFYSLLSELELASFTNGADPIFAEFIHAIFKPMSEDIFTTEAKTHKFTKHVIIKGGYLNV